MHEVKIGKKIRYLQKKQYDIYKKQTSEWKVVVQVVLELNSLMAVGINDLR